MRKRVATLTICSLVLLAACPAADSKGGADDSATGAATVKADLVAANQFYKDKCITCHGSTGRGDGPGAANLDPKPRSLSDAKWQSTVDDAHLRSVIVSGGMAVGKSAVMPPNPELKNKPEVVEGLVQFIRGLK
jgi:mono/diheme cytochrome c family protein